MAKIKYQFIQTSLDWDFQNAKPKEKVFCFQCKHSEWLGINYDPQWLCKKFNKRVTDESFCFEGEMYDWLKNKSERSFCWVCGRETKNDPFCSPKHYRIYLDETRKCENCKYYEKGSCIIGQTPGEDGNCVEFMAQDIVKINQQFIDDYKVVREKIQWKNEPRKYMGPKWAKVPRGSIVKLIAVINGKMAIFEYEGERYNCPVRLLHRVHM